MASPRSFSAKMKMGVLACFCTSGVQAEIIAADYDAVATQMRGVVDFESFDVLPEPGVQIDGVILTPGVSIGERFEGQRAVQTDTDKPYERADPAVPRSLTVLPGAPGENQAIAYHAGFGSNALFPLGPAGFAQIEGRGEGLTAIRYVEPQPAIGFRVHADYADPLGSRPPPGQLIVRIFDTEGRSLDAVIVALRHGVQSVAYRSTDAPIGGILIESVDPGGIAIDDILFALSDLTG